MARRQKRNLNLTPGVNRAEIRSDHMTEASPNPHNEAAVVEMPVRTDQRDLTGGENVAQTPSTREGRLDPSVGEGVTGGVADTDSMFNQADPQAKEAEPSGTGPRDTGKRSRNKKPA